MKKFFLTCYLLCFSLFINAMETGPKENGCAIYAIDATFAEADFYEDMTGDEMDDASWYYYDLCMNTDGGANNMLNPVFL